MITNLLSAIGVATLLASCGTAPHEASVTRSHCDTSVTRFHQLSSKANGESFVVSAPRMNSGLETQQHLSRLANGLIAHGWTKSSSKNANYKVTMDYGISNGRTVHDVAPIIGQTAGGGTTYHSGTASAYGTYGGYASGSYSGTSYTPATYGVVGTVPTTDTVFDRYLFVTIFDSNGRTVLEGKCFSSGYSTNLSNIVPIMIDSFLTDFPGESGKTITQKQTLDE